MFKKITSVMLAFAMVASIACVGSIKSYAAEEETVAITGEEAIAIALEDSAYGAAAQNARVDAAEGADVYNVTFYVGKAVISYRIDAAGAIIARSMNNAPIPY